MIIGLILGDGTLVRKYEKGNTYFQQAQSLIHMAYIHHVFNIFVNSNYCNITKLDVKEIIVLEDGNIYKYLSFSTKSLQEFNRLHSLFYINRKKIVPIEIENLLVTAPIGLAYGVLDDGSRVNTGFHLNIS